MPTGARISPLAGAVLAAVGDGASAAEVVTRLHEHGATVDEATAAGRLDELCELGLARSVQAEEGTTYHVTPLGERLLATSFGANPREVDLLAEIEEMRTELLSTIAHELRAPLTAVRTSVGLLLDPDVDPSSEQQRTLLETIDRNAGRMQRVVGDILDLARFRAGRVQLQLRRFDAIALARSAIGSVSPLAAVRGQALELAARAAPPVPVFGDFRRLEQALVNLLSNAVKYSPDGAPILVTVEAPGDEVSWAVTDTGPGIRPQDQARLFERFFVARREGADTGGIGLGLPITLLIVEAHGGRIEVDSRPGRGSVFRIIVPAAGPEETPSE